MSEKSKRDIKLGITPRGIDREIVEMMHRTHVGVDNDPENIIKELVELIKSNKTIFVADIGSIPGSQFQEIGKKLRGKAVVKVPKKNLFFRALDESKKGKVKELEKNYKGANAILFSDLDSYELAGELIKNKSPAKAKAGQIAPSDLEIPAGPTDLIPGPAIYGSGKS